MPVNRERHKEIEYNKEKKKDRGTHSQFERPFWPYLLFVHIVGAHPLMQQFVNVLHFSQRPLVGDICNIIKKNKEKQKQGSIIPSSVQPVYLWIHQHLYQSSTAVILSRWLYSCSLPDFSAKCVLTSWAIFL